MERLADVSQPKASQMTNDLWEQRYAAFEAAKARELERRQRTGYCDGWWDAPHYVKAWLKQARITDEPEGDLVTDMRTDPEIPHHFPTLKRMRDYVRLKSRGDRLIMAAVPGVWRRYRKWIRERVNPHLL
jgi:hypothetical protein